MKSYFGLCLAFFILMNNISYGQTYECDNNFGDCGTPNQSGGGGAGGGSILIANTDLGDTYQHADDYDDDGVEDPSDNCIRYPNPEQYDRDGDGIGDMCDNCLYVWNPDQENIDGDQEGDFCDSDIDNDRIFNSDDECPYHWGNESCFIANYSGKAYDENAELDNRQNSSILLFEKKQDSIYVDEQQSTQNCNVIDKSTSVNVFFIFLLLFLKRKSFFKLA